MKMLELVVGSAHECPPVFAARARGAVISELR